MRKELITWVQNDSAPLGSKVVIHEDSMVEEPFIYPCSLKLDVASRVQVQLLQKFPVLEITINGDRSTYSPSQAEQIPTGEVLVTLRIPHEGINMPIFYREFSQVLNSEKRGTIQRERE